MADVGVSYVLTTPAGAITFNDGSEDQYYLTEVGGLASTPIRAPIDNAALTDGGLVHDFWRGPRHIQVEGVLLILSTKIQNSIVQIRNAMEDDLAIALESILRSDGTLSFTPQGEANRTYSVRYEIPLEFRHVDNYLLESFTFGLVAADPDWAGSS